jgi:hypothetical protein
VKGPVILLIFVIHSLSCSADFYWTGNSGNWSDGSHWSGTSGGVPCNCIPGPADNVFFDINSFTQPGAVVTIDQIAAANDFTWTGVQNMPELAGSFFGIYIFGSLAFSPAMLVTFTGDINFYTSSPSSTVTTGNLDLNNNLVFAGSTTGGWTLTDSLKTSETLEINSGNFSTGNQYIKAKCLYIVSNASPCLIDLGASVLELSGTNPFIPVFVSGQTLQMQPGTSKVILTGHIASINNSRGSFYDVIFTDTSANSYNLLQNSNGDTAFYHDVKFSNRATISGNNNIHNLELVTGKYYNFSYISVTTIDGTIITNGNCNNYTGINGFLGTSFRTNGTVTGDYLLVKGIAASPQGHFIVSHSADIADNSGWIFNNPGALDYHWVGGQGEWNDTAHWSLTSGGSSTGCIPFIYDNVHFDSLSFPFTGDTVFMPSTLPAFCKTIEWNKTNNSHVFKTTYGGLNIAGSLLLDSNVTIAGNGTIDLIGTDTNYIRTAGRDFNVRLEFLGSGSYHLLDSMAGNNLNIDHQRGNLTTDNWNMRMLWLYSQGAKTRSLNLGSSTLEFTGPPSLTLKGTNMIVNAGTSVIRMKYSSSSQELTNEGYALYDIEGTSMRFLLQDTLGASYHNIYAPAGCNFYGNCTLENLLVSRNTYYYFSPNTVTTVNGSILRSYTGSSGNLGRLYTTLSDTAYLYKASGQLCTDSISLQCIHATGNAYFYAGLHSINDSNNVGWFFQACGASIADISTSNNCTIYPVPVYDELMVECLFNEASAYAVINQSGQCVKKDGFTAVSAINVQQLKAGLYILQVLNKEGMILAAKKFLKL